METLVESKIDEEVEKKKGYKTIKGKKKRKNTITRSKPSRSSRRSAEN